jgi:hypothetical protein
MATRATVRSNASARLVQQQRDAAAVKTRLAAAWDQREDEAAKLRELLEPLAYGPAAKWRTRFRQYIKLADEVGLASEWDQATASPLSTSPSVHDVAADLIQAARHGRSAEAKRLLAPFADPAAAELWQAVAKATAVAARRIYDALFDRHIEAALTEGPWEANKHKHRDHCVATAQLWVGSSAGRWTGARREWAREQLYAIGYNERPPALKSKPQPNHPRAASGTSQPTAAFCIPRPGRLRWNGETDAQPRLSELLRYIVQLPIETESVTFADVKRDAFGHAGKGDKSVRNDISELSIKLSAIKFPWTISAKREHLVICR